MMIFFIWFGSKLFRQCFNVVCFIIFFIYFVRHLKIRRSGTLRQFKKFALGLDISRPTTAELKARPSSDNVSILSAETITELEVDEEDVTESDDSESDAHKR